MSEPEVPPPIDVPPGWRDWINEFPTVKSLAILCLSAWGITPVVLTVTGWMISTEFIAGRDEIDGVIELVDRWLDALNWLTAAAVFGVVGKFATTKPEVIRAEGEVKAKTLVAAAEAAVLTKTAEHAVALPAAPAALESVPVQGKSSEEGD